MSQKESDEREWGEIKWWMRMKREFIYYNNILIIYEYFSYEKNSELKLYKIKNLEINLVIYLNNNNYNYPLLQV